MTKYFQLQELALEIGIIYDPTRIEIKSISSIGDFYTYFQDIDTPEYSLYYRGHSSINYILQPSIMRKASWLEHECDMYNEILIECQEDFVKCLTHLDYLVQMQHYGLPTRLLDITKNPLVALYFACANNPETHGEVVVFNAENSLIKYPGSDTVSILASLPLFKHKMKQTIMQWASNNKLSQGGFNKKAARLLHEIRLEKPAFQAEIVKTDLLNCFFVLPKKRNNRIIKQDGAFIICGLIDNNPNIINEYRYRVQNKTELFIIKANDKEKILNQLAKLSITKATLFPEIEDVAGFIKSKY